MTFSILIPTWNNLPYLKLCIESIRKNSTFSHQILVHINETDADTEQFLDLEQIAYTTSTQNIGICKALNLIAAKATADYIMYMNDDMYCLPQWDHFLAEEINACNTNLFMFSSTMIEPRNTGNRAVIVADFGTSTDTFQEDKLLMQFAAFDHADWSGSSWPPNIVHKSMWQKLNGYNEAFSPGMSSDDDFSMRMWQQGCRLFKGVAASRVYHFQCKSTGRIIRNNGRQQFLQLYGITQNMFNTYFLKKGKPFAGILQGPRPWQLFFRLKKIYLSFKKY
ncbi:MAG: glycosyltransferase [Chitinophagaceae bacterium]|nr:glycosyltransferase [Chitinophagaceae bacterium]